MMQIFLFQFSKVDYNSKRGLNWTQRGSTAFSFILCQYLFVNVCSFFCGFKISLYLPEFGKIKGSNFFCFFNLLLVALDFILQFVNQLLHSLVVLAIFILGECQFFDASVSSTVRLLGIN